MEREKRLRRIALISAITIAATFSSGTSSQAREEKVIKNCSLGNPFEFSVDWEKSRVDFDFDIERGNAFENWTVRIMRDERVLVRKTVRSDEDGDLSREYVRRGQMISGETWTFLARSGNGNTCKASVKF